jgi:hypothetical protein
MGFKIQGEVLIDDKRGVAVLKNLQRESTKTSQSFDRAGTSTKNLAKSLLQLGASGGSASRSFMQLARLGVGGVVGAAAVGAINKFGDAVKNSANDYYETQKSLAGAFETSFKSRNEDEARKGLEATEEIIDRLRGKITQMGSLGKIMGGFEKLTGINLGFGDTQKELDQARANLIVQEQILKAKQEQAKETEKIANETRGIVNESKVNQESLKIAGELGGLQDAAVKAAKEEIKQANALFDENESILKQLIETNREENNRDEIKARQIKKAELELNILKANNSLLKQESVLKEKQFKQGKEVAGGILGATPQGRQALDTATKRRQREVEKENARTADQLTGTEIDGGSLGPARVGQQRAREKLAAQQAAANAPSLMEQIQGQRTGVNPAELASTNAAQRFEDQRKSFGGGVNPAFNKDFKPTPKEEAFSALLKAIEALTKKLPAAVAQ